MKKIRVLIVEDSSVVRQFLELIVGEDPRLEVACAVETAEEALEILDRVAPDVISMDIRLPGMNGFEATQRIMQERPTPIVVVSASAGREDLQIGMNALRAGALAVLEKPTGGTAGDYTAIAKRLCTQLAIMSSVKVVRRWAENRAPAPPGRIAVARARGFRALGIASSTGGPGALVPLLSGLGPAFPLPILLVQHITGSFLEAFVSWLTTVSPFAVEIVKDRSVLFPGKIYVAVQDRHLRVVENGAVRADRGEPVSAQRPSGTVLFESMARVYGRYALGVILTGMGDDGAEGLLRVRESGGYTIAEDSSTAVVYGMPAEAVRIGAVMEALPLPAIAPRILEIAALQSEAA